MDGLVISDDSGPGLASSSHEVLQCQDGCRNLVTIDGDHFITSLLKSVLRSSRSGYAFSPLAASSAFL